MDVKGEFNSQSLQPPIKEGLEVIFLARQPILDQQKRLVAYELLFRSYGTDYADITEHMRATTTVVQNAFSGMGFTAVLGDAQGYINVDTHFLLSDLVEALPPQQVVLEILESVEPSAEIIERLRELKSKGYCFALDDYAGEVNKQELFLSEVDIVKVDLLEIDPVLLSETVAGLRRRGLRLVAEKVETKEQFDEACQLGFDLFQGYHFARPQLLTKKQQKAPAKAHLLRLLSLILSDADIGMLSSEFKYHPTLSYNLIRMVNSAAVGLRERITSLRHAIVLLGRRQLQIWMQLLLYTARDNGTTKNPLLEMAASRGKFMESLAKIDPHSSREYQDTAFMTGILSLVDALLEMPREEIFDEILVADEVKEALLHGTGKLGQLLRLTEKLEVDSEIEVDELLAAAPGLSLENLLQMQVESFLWAGKIDKEVS
ncbi:MAG: EAL domain-containing protein [Pseudomonadota bacterium]